MTQFDLKYKGNYRWEVVCGKVVVGEQTNLTSVMEAKEWAKGFCSSFNSYNLYMEKAIAKFQKEREEKGSNQNTVSKNKNSKIKYKMKGKPLKVKPVVIKNDFKEEIAKQENPILMMTEED